MHGLPPHWSKLIVIRDFVFKKKGYLPYKPTQNPSKKRSELKVLIPDIRTIDTMYLIVSQRDRQDKNE
jgi:hypothetical protein